MFRLLVHTLVFFGLVQTVFAEGWEDRIADARSRARAIETWAEGYGWDYNSVGRMIRSVDVSAIRCQVLAEMMGIGDISGYIRYVSPRPDEIHSPPADSIDPDTYDFNQILGYSWNLNTWMIAVEEFRSMNGDQRAEVWELSCHGQHGIPEGLLGPDWNTSASFRVDDGILYVLGDIVPGFFKEFEAVLSKNEIRVINLGSRGGSVKDAMQAGELIRERGLITALYADCESACPLIFMAGVPPRILVSPKQFYRIGFHQISANGVAIPLDSPAYKIIGAYVKRMGVDDGFVLTAMRSVPPDGMYFPELATLCAAGVITYTTQKVSYDCPMPDSENAKNR